MLNLLASTLKFVMLVYHYTKGRIGPRAIMNIVVTFPQKVKICKECILNYIIPGQVRLGGEGVEAAVLYWFRALWMA